MKRETTPLSLREIEEFIAQTRSTVVPETVSKMIEERDLSLDDAKRWPEVFNPLVEDVRERLNERGISDPGSLRSLKGGARKVRELLECLARFLNRLAQGVLHTRGRLSTIRSFASEAEAIGRLLDDPTITTFSLELIAFCENKEGNPEAAIAKYRESHAIGVRLDDPEIIVRSLFNLGSLFSGQGRYQEAIEAYEKAYDSMSSSGGSPRSLGLILKDLAYVHQLTGQRVKGFEVLLKANELLAENGDESIRVQVLQKLAALYSSTNQFAKAIEMLKEGLELASGLSDVSTHTEILIGLADVYSAIGEREEALDLFKRAVGVYREGDITSAVGLIELRFGDFLAKDGNYAEALDRYTRSLESMDEGEYNAAGAAYLYNARGDMLTNLGDYNRAEDEYQKGLRIAAEVGLPKPTFLMGLRMADLARLRGDSEEACLLYEEVLDQEDVGQSDERAEGHKWLGELLRESGDYAKALHHQEEYARLKLAQGERLLNEQLSTLRIQHHLENYQEEAELERLRRKEKEAELQEVTMQLTEKGELIGSVRKRVREILKDLENDHKPVVANALKQIVRHVSGRNEADDGSLLYLQAVDAEYYDRLRLAHPDLTAGQVRLCGLLRSGMSNPDVARVLHITVESLMKQRYRLRKALGLSRKQGLEKYLGLV